MLVDTSVWIDHLRRGNAKLRGQLEAGEVACHPFVVGELACGNLKGREEVLSLVAALPQTPMAQHDEVLALIEAPELDQQIEGDNRRLDIGMGVQALKDDRKSIGGIVVELLDVKNAQKATGGLGRRIQVSLQIVAWPTH